MSSRQEQKRRSHESILDSAAALVRKNGIGGAGVAEVMKGADLTVGGFYAHFASKDELIDETLRRTGASLRKRLFANLDEKPEGDRAEVILKRYLSPAHRDAGTLGCPMPAIVGEAGTTATQHRTVVAEQTQAIVDRLEEHLPADGIIPRHVLAIALVALMYGGLALSRAVKGSELSDDVLRACRAAGAALLRAGASPAARRRAD